jgi:hypothetical protein
MFTINLLKEETASGNCFDKTLTYLVAAILPAIVIVVIAVLFVGNAAVMASQRKKITDYEAFLAELSGAVRMQKDFDAEQKSIRKNLSELPGSLDNYMQWSPILIEIVKTMPDIMIITDLQVKKTQTNRKVTTSDGKVKPIVGFKNTLSLSLSGNSQHNYDGDVREYGNRLRSSQTLNGLGLEQISVSQEEKVMQGQKVVLYGIKCVFITN